MLLISFERLATLNYQTDFAKAFSFVNERILAGSDAYQFVSEICVKTERFPEGHIYPRGTVLIDEEGIRLPAPVKGDRLQDAPDLFDSEKVRPLRLPRRIAIYNGLNCWPYFFDPYKNLLEAFSIPFIEADDAALRDGLLEDCDLLIVPGGPDAGESYYAGLGDKGIENIKCFVREGGNYIGSCAGAFFPLAGDESLPESRMLMGLIPVTAKNGLDFTQTGTALVRLALAPEGRGALYSLSYGSYRSVDAIYWEGPTFVCDEGAVESGEVSILATYDMLLSAAAEGGRWKPKNQIARDALEYGNQVSEGIFLSELKDTPAAIEAVCGKGRLHLYSFHPEFGTPTAENWESGQTLFFIMNSIYDLASG